MIYQPPILKAVPEFGTDDAPRYAIQNLVNEQYWTGQGFSPKWEHAALYAQPNHASLDMRQIMMQVYKDEAQRIFVAPTRIEVFGEASIKQIQHWLSRAALMRIRNSEYGNGPGNSLVMPAIHWAQMESSEMERGDI